jgi:hypothetical protein
VTVEDEGEGFDYHALHMALPEDARRISNRGYILINNLCRTLEFNDCGNRVTVLIDAG